MMDLDACSVDEVIQRRRSIRKELAAASGLKDLRIAVLGGSTTDELVNFLELLLLSAGFRPVFYQSEFGRFYEDAVLDPDALIAFKPDIAYIHTSCRNVRNFPPLDSTEEQFAASIEAELSRFRQIWEALETNLGCQIIQNNFETPPFSIFGNLDAVARGGQSRFLMQLNLAFAQEISGRAKVILQDVHGLAAELGGRNWFNWDRYFSYKLLLTPAAHLEVARSLKSLVLALYGRSRKVLILDLDNTLWGGVIGDDGVDRIKIGRETPMAEAYTAFQEYCLMLRNRGILLAVCSKNNEDVAMSGFQHPSSVLKLEHFSAFKANWEPKHENIQAIAKELNLGTDSFVFVDDNPAERALVKAQMPEVAVPEVGSDVTNYADFLEQGRYFEAISLSKEDLERAALYAENASRAAFEKKFANYGEYLDSLEMTAEIDIFKPVYLDRIAQLTNKTNQFNLTTRRYSLAEMEAMVSDAASVGLYGRLIDRFGDNGLISVVAGQEREGQLHMDLWLMSCRVLKRDMEVAMLDAVAAHALQRGLSAIIGYYFPTKKNGMVADFYSKLGFVPHEIAAQDFPEGSTVWKLDLAGYTPRNLHIKVLEYANA